MTEEETRKIRSQCREFPETMELLGTIRNRLADLVFKTPILAAKEREDLCLRVQTLDAMREEMDRILKSDDGQKAIDDYLKTFEVPVSGTP